jgi:hypothetical protein
MVNTQSTNQKVILDKIQTSLSAADTDYDMYVTRDEHRFVCVKKGEKTIVLGKLGGANVVDPIDSKDENIIHNYGPMVFI